MSDLLKQAEFAQSKASHPGSSVWVAASAGTGKTKVLTDRLLRLLLDGNEPHRILCLTFTKAAAAEMANRLYKKLSTWATLEDSDLLTEVKCLTTNTINEEDLKRARTLFTYVLDTPGGLKIQTIHGFCQALLKRFPLEAGIPPHFDVLESQAAKDLLHQAQTKVLNRDDKSAEEEEALGVLAQQFDTNTFSSLLKDMEKFGNIKTTGLSPIKPLNLNAGLSASDLKHAADILISGQASDHNRGLEIRKWLENPYQDENGFRDYAQIFLTSKNEIRKKLCLAELSKKQPSLLGILTEEATRIEQIIEHLNAQKIQRVSDSLKQIGGAILNYYKDLKLKNSYLDYDDLITKTVSLLSQADVAPWVLYKLDGGLDHILVDEAQDTSPEQWKVISALAEEFFHNTQGETERTLFVVGDTKQSIYSFQGAEPESFSLMRNRFQEFSRNLKRPWSVVDLDTSFRSSEAVLKVVDHVFTNPDLKESLLHNAPNLKHHAFREGHAGLVELWPVMKPEESESSDVWEMPTQEYISVSDPEIQTAELIAERIDQMLRTGEILHPKGRPIKASDILILVQRRGSFVSKLIRSLKKKNIPVAGSDRMILTNQLVVKDLIALGEFLLLPDDDLILASVLKSPLFNLTDDDLIELCPSRRGSLWSTLLSSEKYRQVTDKLKYILNLQDTIRPYELYEEVLTSLGGKKDFLRRLGLECLDPMEEFLAQVLNFEQTSTPTLQGFIQYMQTAAIEIKRDFEQGTRDEIRVMTVHGSKGLQAPIVILPDTIRTPNKPEKFLKSDDSFLWSPPQVRDTASTRDLKSKARAKKREEYWRLLYVAMTRAEDRLYVCGWETRKSNDPLNWHSVIEKSLQKIGHVEEDTGICRYETVQRLPVSFAAQNLPSNESIPSPNWLLSKAPFENDPFTWINPSTIELGHETEKGDKEHDHVSDFAAHRGTMIHKLLEVLPEFNGNRNTYLESYLNQSVHSLNPDQIQEIRSHVLRVLESDSFKAISGLNSRVEIPVVGKLNDQYISGQIDRLVEEDSRVLIIDYKTNQYPPHCFTDIPKSYIKQMEIYKDLLTPLYPAKTIETFLFWTETCELMTLELDIRKAA